MLRTDLKIFKSQRMTQNANAGGQRTANEVANGQLNEVFGNISAIDHAQSAVDIVKVYPGVSTADTQLLQDAHVLINEPPEDPKVDILLIEAPDITDASTRSNIVDAIESGIIAGQLLRSGLSGMLAGQNSIAQADLLNITAPAAGEETNVYLTLGQIIAISVEYPGAASLDYPRFTHYAKVVGGTATSGSGSTPQGDIIIEPAIPYNTPGRSITINGATNTTKLRRTNSADNVVYHGVTRLTAAANETGLLSVERTTGNLLPRLTTIVERTNQPFISDVGLVRKKATFAAAGRGYNVEISDIVNLTGANLDSNIIVEYTSWAGSGGTITVGMTAYNNGVLSFVLPSEPMPDTDVNVLYYSSDRYARLLSSVGIPANTVLLTATMFGTISAGAASPRRFYISATALPNQLFVDGASGRELAAEININTGAVTFFGSYSAINYTAVVLAIAAPADVVTTADFVLPFAQYQTDSLYITATLEVGGIVSASADESGAITGIGVTGSITNGRVNLVFTDPVLLGTISYTVNEITQLTPPASLYSINQLRIANGGVVPLFRAFGVVSITNNVYSSAADLPASTVLTQRPGAFIDIIDSTGASLWHPLDAHYSYNKTTGDVTIIDASDFTGPFEITDIIGELALVSAVNSNQLVLTAPLQGTYPAGSVVSSVQVLGNLQASATVLFDMTIWSNVWSDEITGSPATANFNELNYPIEVENRSAINERWVIVFTSATAFVCIGEGLGQIASGDTLNDFAPINPNTLQPYFVIRSQAWGGGWSAGECVRFNTEAAAKPLVLLRSVSAGHSQIEQDSIRLHFRGNAD